MLGAAPLREDQRRLGIGADLVRRMLDCRARGRAWAAGQQLAQRLALAEQQEAQVGAPARAAMSAPAITTCGAFRCRRPSQSDGQDHGTRTAQGCGAAGNPRTHSRGRWSYCRPERRGRGSLPLAATLASTASHAEAIYFYVAFDSENLCGHCDDLYLVPRGSDHRDVLLKPRRTLTAAGRLLTCSKPCRSTLRSAAMMSCSAAAGARGVGVERQRQPLGHRLAGTQIARAAGQPPARPRPPRRTAVPAPPAGLAPHGASPPLAGSAAPTWSTWRLAGTGGRRRRRFLLQPAASASPRSGKSRPPATRSSPGPRAPGHATPSRQNRRASARRSSGSAQSSMGAMRGPRAKARSRPGVKHARPPHLAPAPLKTRPAPRKTGGELRPKPDRGSITWPKRRSVAAACPAKLASPRSSATAMRGEMPLERRQMLAQRGDLLPLGAGPPW